LSYEKDTKIFGRTIDREYKYILELFTFSCSLWLNGNFEFLNNHISSSQASLPPMKDLFYITRCVNCVK